MLNDQLSIRRLRRYQRECRREINRPTSEFDKAELLQWERIFDQMASELEAAEREEADPRLA